MYNIVSKKEITVVGLDIIMSAVCIQVKSERLVNDIGLKTRVTLGDILDIIKSWRKSSKTSVKTRCVLFRLLCTN
jgi:hypothetical protein